MTTNNIVDESEMLNIYEEDEIPIFVLGGETSIYESFVEDEDFPIEDPDEWIDPMELRLLGSGRQLTVEELNW